MKPLIGITSSFRDEKEKALFLNMTYINAVIAAGGVPVVLPNKPALAAEYIPVLDGILFSGGGDVYGKYFNQPTNEKASGLSENRDQFEITLLKLAKAANKPVMGICRGEQVINIALGGDIIQHMENHRQADSRNCATHQVKIEPGTILNSWIKQTDLPVNSFHHQVVDKLGEGLIVTARSEDGFTEAWENSGSWFCFGVQWHPEALLESPEHIIQLGLFKPFIEACKNKGN